MYDMNNIKKLARTEAAAPDAMRGFEAFDAAALKGGVVPRKYKELTALAVALTTQCPYCLEIHKGATINAGATEEELAETIAWTLRAGAAITHGAHLMGES
jgi:AhpD family alkylhydroperoxidase